MREKFHLDVYNVIIIALIPFVLLVAWGLTWGYERNLHAQQCEDAIGYLEEVTAIAPEYVEADTLEDADDWLDSMQELGYPEPASDLHNGALSAFTYASTTDLQVDTAQPGGLYDQLTTFKEVLDDGRDTLVDQCPDTEPLIVDAFPMYFREEGE
jgi:hypothetical protein